MNSFCCCCCLWKRRCHCSGQKKKGKEWTHRPKYTRSWNLWFAFCHEVFFFLSVVYIFFHGASSLQAHHHRSDDEKYSKYIKFSVCVWSMCQRVNIHFLIQLLQCYFIFAKSLLMLLLPTMTTRWRCRHSFFIQIFYVFFRFTKCKNERICKHNVCLLLKLNCSHCMRSPYTQERTLKILKSHIVHIAYCTDCEWDHFP